MLLPKLAFFLARVIAMSSHIMTSPRLITESLDFLGKESGEKIFACLVEYM